MEQFLLFCYSKKENTIDICSSCFVYNLSNTISLSLGGLDPPLFMIDFYAEKL